MPHAVISAIEHRHSASQFDPDRFLADAQIRELIRLATRAPTAFNLQNWRFIAVRTAGAKARLQEAGWGQPKISEAAVTFIVCGQLPDYRTMPDRLQPSVEAGIMPASMVPGWTQMARDLYDGKAQAQRDEAVRSAIFGAATLMLAAHGMGLASGPMCGFDPEQVARGFGLGADEVPVLLLAVGHAAPGNWPQKPRRPLAQVLQFA